MNIVLLTTDGDNLGGVFADGYRTAGGPSLASLVTLKYESATNPISTKMAMAVKLLGVDGAMHLASAKLRLWKSDRHTAGLNQSWPAALASSETTFLSDRDAKNEEFLCELEQLKPDVLVSVGAPVIFGRRLLTIPKIGSINVHNGLLPKYRGHFGTFWEVAHQESHAYVCAHAMVNKVDSGRILDWERIEVAETKSFFDLLVWKKRLGGRLLARVLTKIQNSGKLPSGRPIEHVGPIPNGYHSFPSSHEIWKLKWKPVQERRAA